MKRYDVYGSTVSYEETNAAETTRELLATVEAEDEGEARGKVFASLTPDQRKPFQWGNLMFRCLVVEHGVAVATHGKVKDKAMLKTIAREYFDDMSADERDAYEGR